MCFYHYLYTFVIVYTRMAYSNNEYNDKYSTASRKRYEVVSIFIFFIFLINYNSTTVPIPLYGDTSIGSFNSL